jgi:hypothetical protein
MIDLHNRQSKIILGVFAAALVSVAGLMIINTPKAEASIGLNPLLGFTMPADNYNYLNNCDGGVFSPAFTQWVSAAAASGTTTITVPYGTPSVGLQLNWNGATCHSSPGSVVQSRLQVLDSPTPGVSGIAGQQLGLIFGAGSPVGYYTVANRPFTFAPAGGFTHTQTYTIQLNTKSINQFPSAYRCVSPGSAIIATTAIDNFAPCPISSPTFQITIVVVGQPPIGNIDDVSCEGISGWTVDMDRPGRSIKVHAYLDAPAGQPGSIPIANETANSSRSDVNAALHITGNHGFNISPLPAGYPNGTSHRVWVYGIGVNAAGNEDGVNAALVNSGSAAAEYVIPTAAECALSKYDLRNLNPVIDFNAPDDRPTGANIQTGIRVNSMGTPKVNDIKIERSYYLIKGGVQQPNLAFVASANSPASGTQITVNKTPNQLRFGTPNAAAGDDVNFAALNPGDELCVEQTISPAAGQVDPDTFNPISPPTVASRHVKYCRAVVGKPYLAVFGGDVLSGGGLGIACIPKVSNIDTFIGATGQGAGVQFAAFASGTIEGFASAKMRPVGAGGPNEGLSFANTAVPSGNFYGGGGSCNTNYPFNDAVIQTLGPTATITTAMEGDYLRPSGNLGLDGGTVGDGKTLTIYVKGNLRITDNILYQTTGWTTAGQIPKFTVIVQGNIYIDKAVSTLNGNFVAIPRDDGTGGILYTCSESGTVWGGDYLQVMANCGSQLTVYGSLTAQTIKWLRTFGTVGASTATEYPVPGPVRAGEIIISGPEDYITGGGVSTVGPLDAITSLPPVL